MEAEFYQEMAAGMEERAKLYGYRVVIVDANRSAAWQHNQVENFVSMGASAIVLTPFDSQAIGAAIAYANEHGVPVFTADIASISPDGNVVSNIASDNIQGGVLAGKLMCRALPNGGKIAIIDQPSMTSVLDRTKGFKKGITGCNLTVVADITGEGQREKSSKVMEDILQSHPDVQGVFGINDDTALGALSALTSAGKVGQVKIIGFDAAPEAQGAIKAGLLYGDAIQHPGDIGRQTIDVIHDYLEHRPVQVNIPVRVGLFTQAGEEKP